VAVALALIAVERGWGLFNVFDVPYWIALVVSVLALDLAIYLQHVMFHAVPALWRLHRMHHFVHCTSVSGQLEVVARFPGKGIRIGWFGETIGGDPAVFKPVPGLGAPRQFRR
jgi:hypothetical protein